MPHHVDVYVGTRMRLRRREIGKSQTELADALGITFQQVQKYEKGANRVSASMLWQAAQALQVPLTYFFEDLDQSGMPVVGPAHDKSALYSVLALPHGEEMVRLLLRMPPAIRKAIRAIMRKIAGEPDNAIEDAI